MFPFRMFASFPYSRESVYKEYDAVINPTMPIWALISETDTLSLYNKLHRSSTHIIFVVKIGGGYSVPLNLRPLVNELIKQLFPQILLC